MDFTDAFDKRLEAIRAFREPLAAGEADAAILIFERLKTAEVICRTIFADGKKTNVATPAAQSTVVAVFEQLCEEIRRQQNSDTSVE
ncbi:MAG: hypothetical protein LBE75_06000 [Burkholderiales bacterium]|jgi:hypothetical protein|nr:hypothetical protein [Burkholderiales bacterium]